jgi:transposase
MITPETRAEIRRLYYAEHWKVGTIAMQLGVHRDAVRRVLALDESRPLLRMRPRQLDPYAEFITETLACYPTLRATRLWDMLRARGYQGTVRTVRDQVRAMRPKRASRAFLRTEPLCGEQAQIDWAHVARVSVPGGQRSLWLFVMVLSYSRAMWGEFVYDLSIHSLRRSLVRASRYFAGCTRQWLFDNPRTVVLGRHGDVVRFHPELLALCGQLCVQPRLCAVRQPQQKGRVERAIRYVRDRFLAGRSITCIERGNRELLAFVDQIAHQRPHPSLPGHTVAQVLADEQASLLSVPDPLPDVTQATVARVDKTALLRFDTNTYSAPPRFAGAALTVLADDGEVRLLAEGVEVARHNRCWGRRQLITDPAHRRQLLDERRASHDLAGRDRLRVELPHIDALLARWLQRGHHLGTHIPRTLKLLV